LSACAGGDAAARADPRIAVVVTSRQNANAIHGRGRKRNLMTGTR
jgi:hypothetical protein